MPQQARSDPGEQRYREEETEHVSEARKKGRASWILVGRHEWI
jgi:hypothetical protein